MISEGVPINANRAGPGAAGQYARSAPLSAFIMMAAQPLDSEIPVRDRHDKLTFPRAIYRGRAAPAPVPASHTLRSGVCSGEK